MAADHEHRDRDNTGQGRVDPNGADTDGDEALAWAGDEPLTAPPSVESVRAARADRAATPQLPAALLVSYGILAGAFLLYTVGWVVSVQRYNAATPVSTEPLTAVMFGLGQILAVASPALWFGASFVLLRDRKPLIRLLVLVLGLVVVLPWPFVLGV